MSQYPPAAYRMLVEKVAGLWLTEERQKAAQELFPGDYAAVSEFMACVQIEQTRNVAQADAAYRHMVDTEKTKLRSRQQAKLELIEEERAAKGYEAQGFVNGAAFIFDVDDRPAAVWGRDGDILMADGEALMLVGKSGVGKTTVAAQFVRARLGLSDEALGFPVQPTAKKVLYLACDRPRQAARALRRLFTPAEREILRDRLVFWQGPPPKDMAAHPEKLVEMCVEAGADTVIVDSLKDVALGLSEDGVGASYNSARQLALANGIQVLELHHQVKRGANGAAPNRIEDVYGSTWLTGGAGSVIILDGDAGDPVVKFRHLKSPVNELGPLDLFHDHETGLSSFGEKTDLVSLARFKAITALDAAKAMFDTEKPTRAEKEKARRQLDALCRSGGLQKVPGVTGAPDTYAPRVPLAAEPEAAVQDFLDDEAA